MKKGLFFTLIFASLQLLSNLEEIPTYNLDFYHKAFPTAFFQKKVIVYDPITTDGINNHFLHIYDQTNKFLGTLRNVETTPGCNNFCAPLSFTLTYNDTGSFKKLIIRDFEPLMKEYGKVEFTQEDYDKINNSLTKDPESFKTANKPEDLVDAVSGATKQEYREDTVTTAALSHFRIYQYNKQTLQDIARENASEILSAIDFTLSDQFNNIVNFNYSPEGEFKNKITVMLFFATWCHYCNLEMPQFEELYKKYKNNSKVRLIAVRTFRAKEVIDYSEFLNNHQISFQILNDNPREIEPYSKVGRLYNLKYVPKTFVFDRDGAVIPTPEITDTAEYFSSLDNLLISLLK